MNESDVKRAVKKYLKEIGAYYYMAVPMGYGAATLDFLACYKGKFYGIETKRPGTKGVTARQNCTMAEIAKADGRVCVENSVELETLKEMLSRVV